MEGGGREGGWGKQEDICCSRAPQGRQQKDAWRGGGMPGRMARAMESRGAPNGSQSLVQCDFQGQSVGTKGGR